MGEGLRVSHGRQKWQNTTAEYRNLPNLYPCLAMERSPTAMSPLPQPRRRPLGHVPLPAGLQTLLVQRLQAHLQRSDQYAAPSEQTVAGVLDPRDLSAVPLVFVAAYRQRAGEP